ncbi:Malonate-semialdehyde dehydrogenase (Partial), partial [Seminavis robusta]|eukprot:Sro1131_g244580.1 Malonate-semialdehyde dehydrogenase (404) ;mRNA; r:2-1447
MSNGVITIDNYIGGSFVAPGANYLDVVDPAVPGKVIAKCGISTAKDVDIAVEAAKKALPAWSKMTIKARAAIMMKFHSIIQREAEDLARMIVLENGKNFTEAMAEVAKANETVEYACSLPQLAEGKTLRVSSQVTCEDRRLPLGVVASIVPFNFPLMVPMWTLPIALVMGNTVICKPSEKVPMTLRRVAELAQEAGFPAGVFNLVNGVKESVEALIDHPDVKAVTFVGSSPVAEIVSTRCRKLHKRSSDICVSFAGCAGQRCMAASVLLLVGGEVQEGLLAKVVELASKIEPGSKPGQMGPVIDEASYKKIIGYVTDAEKCGAEIILDGRPWNKKEGCKGNWIGPTIIKHKQSSDKTMKEEVFGPVLSVYSVSSWEEAIAIENANPFGNAACIYTTNGGNAEWF